MSDNTAVDRVREWFDLASKGWDDSAAIHTINGKRLNVDDLRALLAERDKLAEAVLEAQGTIAAYDLKPCLGCQMRDARVARLEAYRRDSERMDWLENEMSRELMDIAVGIPVKSLFRRNLPITRQAIDAEIRAANV